MKKGDTPALAEVLRALCIPDVQDVDMGSAVSEPNAGWWPLLEEERFKRRYCMQIFSYFPLLLKSPHEE